MARMIRKKKLGSAKIAPLASRKIVLTRNERAMIKKSEEDIRKGRVVLFLEP